MIIETNPSRVFKNKFSPAREAEWEKMIGQQVWKNPKTTSKFEPKPFKSGNKINTVRGTIRHPITQQLSFLFEEDNTFVECSRCSIAPKDLYEMSEDLQKECCDVLAKRFGLLLTTDQLRSVTNITVAQHLIKYDAPDDTYDRDLLIDMVCLAICGLSFPINGNKPEVMSVFARKFLQGCEDRKFELTPKTKEYFCRQDQGITYLLKG
jgi:hypothetical protein